MTIALRGANGALVSVKSLATDDPSWREGRALALICLLAVALRAASVIWFPNIVHADENQQYLEQANRLLTGRGMIPWEYAVGVRSWLTPAVIAVAMAPAVWVSASPSLVLGSATAAMIAFSTIAVWASFRLGERVAGRSGAVAAGIAAAVWCELVHYSTHVLADSLSAVFLIWGLAVAYRRPTDARRPFLIAGILFGFAFITRIQLAPALAVAVIGLCGLQSRRYVAMIVGGVAPFILQGLVDWATWGAPFHSLVLYLITNAGGVADQFGRLPIYWYFRLEGGVWRFAAPLILITAVAGARRAPLLALVGAVMLATFSLVGHKEARFVYPALPLLFTLCGVGMADLARLASAKTRLGPRLALAGLLTLFATASAVTAVGPKMTSNWLQHRPQILALREINRDPAACGVGWDEPGQWAETGLVYLRRDLQFYLADDSAPDRARAFNYLIMHDRLGYSTTPKGFQRLHCSVNVYSPWLVGEVCLWRRPGGCDPDAAPLMKAAPGPETPILQRLGLPTLLDEAEVTKNSERPRSSAK